MTTTPTNGAIKVTTVREKAERALARYEEYESADGFARGAAWCAEMNADMRRDAANLAAFALRVTSPEMRDEIIAAVINGRSRYADHVADAILALLTEESP